MTNPINPADIVREVQPNSKRRSPSPIPLPSASAEEIQPLKRSALNLTLNTQIVKLLFAQIFLESDTIQVTQMPSYCIISNAIQQYHFFPSEVQKTILFGDYKSLDKEIFVKEFTKPISCYSNEKTKSFNLSFFSIFFSDNDYANSIADYLKDINKDHLIAEGVAFAVQPYYSQSAPFLNPEYLKQTQSLIAYLAKIHKGDLFIGNIGLNPADLNKKTGIEFLPISIRSDILRTDWTNSTKSLAIAESEEAQSLVDKNPTNNVSTFYLRRLSILCQYINPFHLLDSLYFDWGPYSFEIDGFCYASSTFIKALLTLNYIQPNYDANKSFKENLTDYLRKILPSSSFLSSLKMEKDNVCTIIEGNITHKIKLKEQTQADTEFLPLEVDSTAPAAFITEMNQTTCTRIIQAMLFPLVRDITINFIAFTSKGVQISVNSDGSNYSITFNYEQQLLLKGNVVNINDNLIAPINVYKDGKVIGKTSIFAIFYDDNDLTRNLVQQLKLKSSSDRLLFLAHGITFALHPILITPAFANPKLIPLLTVLHKNFVEINNGSERFPSGTIHTPIRIGEATWSFTPSTIQTFSRYYLASLEADACAPPLKPPSFTTPHIQLWNRFFKKCRYLSHTHDSVKVYTNSVNHLKGPFLSEHQCFKNIILAELEPYPILESDQLLSSRPAPAIAMVQAPVQPLVLYLERTKALLYPFAESILTAHESSTGLIVRTSKHIFSLHLSNEQKQILSGTIPPNLDIACLTQEIKVEVHTHRNFKPFGSNCLLALLYENNEFTTLLLEKIKPLSNDHFLAQAVEFALAPFYASPTLGYYARPDLLLKTNLFHAHLRRLTQGDLPCNIINQPNITIADVNWSLKKTKFAIPTTHNFATLEHRVCMRTQTEDFSLYSSSHIEKWRNFYRNVTDIIVNPQCYTVNYRNKWAAFKGTAISGDPLFNLIINNEPLPRNIMPAPALLPLPLPLPPAPAAAAPLPLPLPLPLPPPPAAAVPSNSQIEYARIGNVIEKFWLQNPVNYSRWIKLLRESRAVFSFESLPKELMDPLKGFKKEHVEHILKLFGVGLSIEGDLPDDLVDKAVPTLLRVKMAEFNLYRKSGFKPREEREIELKPCYLVKPGPRFVHIIKVTALFDTSGFISGFILNGKEPVEKNISLDEYSKIEEEVKQKKVIVLQRETVKLVEEAPQEASPPRQKRVREDTEKKEEIQREPKEAKSAPILPPVPQSRLQKRPAAATEGTVHPHAPKESKFKDRSDISTDKPRAVGKPSEGGIIAPPQLIDEPLAPALQEAVSLDDLFSALSQNAIAQVSHAVKSGLNYYKAIFAEEPLAYEGLELIRKLKDTPLPNTPCLVPKAKKYQWDYVLEAKRREKAGLGTILAPYMGLGKTWIYNSKIILDIYEGVKGHHLVITPKPLRKTIYDDAIVILNNARLNAFIHLKSTKWGDYCATRIIKETDRAEKEFLLSLLGLFSEEEFVKIMTGRGPLIGDLCATFVGTKFQQHPNKIKRLYEYCKSIAPKDLPERGHFDEKGLERILTFSSSRIKKCDDGRELVKHTQNEESHLIIASYEQAEQLANNPTCTGGCASITFDEAQYIHNPEIKIAKSAETLLRELKPKSKLAVTGTPIENGVEDLFQLVGLMAPQLKCPSILSTLSSLSSSASRFVKSKQPELALSHLLKFHGHLQAYLNLVSQNLVLILQKDDPRVKEAWGQGATLQFSYENISVPEIARQKYQEAHELFKTRRADPVTGKKLDSNMAYYARVASIMLDPNLQAANLTKTDMAVQGLLKSIKSESDMAKIEELIDRSALLTSIIYSPKTIQAHRDKKVALIFVANIAVGKVVRKVLKKKYPEAKSYLMYGDQKDVKKDRIITKLKKTDKSRFGVLSIESGSTGFSIPEASTTIIPTLSYNVATEMQAIGRMDRATSTGIKQVVYPLFDIFSEKHIPVVQAIKKLTFKNFFTPAPTQLERLKDMAELIRNNIYQSFLNEKRDADLAKQEMEDIDNIIQTLLDEVEEEELKSFVERLTPPLPKYVSQPAKVAIVAKGALPPVQTNFVRAIEPLPLARSAPAAGRERIAGNTLFKMPLPVALSYDDKIRLACFIYKNRKELEAPIKEIYNAFKDPQVKTLVREGGQMQTPASAKAYQTYLQFLEDAKNEFKTIDDIGIDTFIIEGQDYVRVEQTNIASVKRVKVCRGANNVIEILI